MGGVGELGWWGNEESREFREEGREAGRWLREGGREVGVVEWCGRKGERGVGKKGRWGREKGRWGRERGSNWREDG